MSEARLTATPTSTLMDEVVSIKVTDLQPDQKVTVVTSLQDAGKRFLGHGWYTASNRGLVDLETAECTGGSFSGVEPMGLFWSMLPERDQKPGMSLMKRDVTTPYEVELTVYDGHFDAMDTPELAARAALAATTIERWYQGKNVERTDVRDGRLVATFFIPKKGANHPGVLDLFGTVGGILEHRAALLASRGFATMALSYFNPTQDKPVKTDLEYFEEAVEYIHNHPRVSKEGVGVVGVSLGADMALLTSVICHKVKAVIFINGCYHNTSFDITYSGELFPASDGNYSDLVNEAGYAVGKRVFANLTAEQLEKTAIPIERSNANILLVCGADDQFATTAPIEYFPKRMAANGKQDKCHVLRYPKAGHLLEPPISPVCTHSYHASLGSVCLWGGEPKAHAHAQEDLWLQMQRFLWNHLQPKDECTAAKL